eukprot:6194142-Pleurochrysis_carterae.AAC.3
MSIAGLQCGGASSHIGLDQQARTASAFVATASAQHAWTAFPLGRCAVDARPTRVCPVRPLCAFGLKDLALDRGRRRKDAGRGAVGRGDVGRREGAVEKERSFARAHMGAPALAPLFGVHESARKLDRRRRLAFADRLPRLVREATLHHEVPPGAVRLLAADDAWRVVGHHEIDDQVRRQPEPGRLVVLGQQHHAPNMRQLLVGAVAVDGDDVVERVLRRALRARRGVVGPAAHVERASGTRRP